MHYLYGKPIAQTIYEDLASRIEKLSFTPAFADVVVGGDLVMDSYVRKKEVKAHKLGLRVADSRLSEDASTQTIAEKIVTLQDDPAMSGIIVQLPLPEQVEYQRVVEAIAPEVDVDVLRPDSQSRFYEDDNQFIFPTARAIMRLIEELPLSPETTNVVIIGYGMLVGKPVRHLLLKKGYAVQTITRETDTPRLYTKQADLLISAAGVPGLVTDEFIKEGAAVIDAGTAEANGVVKGDVDVASIRENASYVAPVPGGVGPLTVAMLLSNVVEAAEQRK